jgi:hypothetical protein
VLVAEMPFHEFCTENSLDDNEGCDSIQNDNTRKKKPGVGGVMKYAGQESPAKKLWVELYSPTNSLVASGKSDEDGYYQIAYKHTGKAATYKVRLSRNSQRNTGCTQEKSASLKGNGLAEVNFSDSTGVPEDLPGVVVACQPAQP